MRRKLLIACAVLIAIPVVLWGVRQIYLATLPTPQLPLEKEIVKIHAATRDWPATTITEFDVSKHFWNRILNSLSQARRDDFAAKWQVYGQLKITHRDGSILNIDLYHRGSRDEAVFAVTYPDDRTYYRGGSQTELHSALDEAQAAATPETISENLGLD